MNKFSRWVDRYCALHPRFGISNLMMFVVLGNVLVWLFTAMDTTGTMYQMLNFNAYRIVNELQIWRVFTFILVPNTSGLSLLITLYFYYFIGTTLENHWGTGRFTMYYFCGVIFNVIFGLVMYLFFNWNIGIDPYYMNLSMFFAFALINPDMTVLLFFIIPIKMKWLAIFDAVFFVMGVIGNQFPINLLPIVAVLNLFLFCWDDLYRVLKPNRAQSRNRANFQKEVSRMKREEATKDYSRKCEVCGKTDRDYPDLEFRYCSRCEGYHCYCIDHINNHVHKSN